MHRKEPASKVSQVPRKVLKQSEKLLKSGDLEQELVVGGRERDDREGGRGVWLAGCGWLAWVGITIDLSISLLS